MLKYPYAQNQRRFRLSLTLILFTVSLATAVMVLPQRSGAKRTVQGPNSEGKRTRFASVPGEVLVRYRTERAAKAKPAVATMARADGSILNVTIERLRAADLVPGLRLAKVAYEDTAAAIEALRQEPDVLYAEPNYIWHLDNTPNDPRFLSGEMYGLTKIGGPQAWDTTTGSASVVIGVVDEGIDINHPDLSANIWTNPSPGSIPGITGDLHGYNFVNNTGNIPAEDHATHVAGTAGARGNNATGVVGVNWSVGLMSLRALDPSGGNIADIINAYSYAKQMRDLFISSGGASGANVRVLNNSYGGGGFSQAAFDAISALNQSGILFVGSAGNNDDGNTNNDVVPHYPSDYNLPNTICVGATNQTDLMASFSHIGPNSVTLGAPGQSILSTLPGNNYGLFSGTSMASPHVAGAAALLSAANPNLSVRQVRALLIFNGDPVADLSSKTITGRRLNVANSLIALAENDSTPPGAVTNLHINTQTGRSLNIGWNASGDDGTVGQASLYELTFVDAISGAEIPLKRVLPASSGSPQSVDVKVPFRHLAGSIKVKPIDNVGNEGPLASLNVSVSVADGDPYEIITGAPEALSTGGTGLLFNCDDCYKSAVLPFSFPFFGQNYTSITVSSNGNIYFTPPSPPTRTNGEADDVPSSAEQLTKFKMISGLWDDLDLRTSSRANADVYVVNPDPNRVILRWQGVPCNFNGSICTGGAPVNFEIELQSSGTIRTRYGAGNTGLFPVVGVSGGDPDAYLITSFTSETSPLNLTNAQTVTYDYHPAAPGSTSHTVGLYAPTSGNFFLKTTNMAGPADLVFGYGPAGAGWIPVAGDWNGDGVDTVGLYDPTNSFFFLKNSNMPGPADLVFGYGPGGAGWIPVVGDWNGDGVDTVGLYDPVSSFFFLRNSNTPGPADLVFGFGPAGANWRPLVGDWNGDGVDTIGLYNPANSFFFLKNTNTSGAADLVFGYGPAGANWRPLVGDWNGDGVDTIALFDPVNSNFFMRNSNASGPADFVFGFGPAGANWTPLIGDWNG